MSRIWSLDSATSGYDDTTEEAFWGSDSSSEPESDSEDDSGWGFDWGNKRAAPGLSKLKPSDWLANDSVPFKIYLVLTKRERHNSIVGDDDQLTKRKSS